MSYVIVSAKKLSGRIEPPPYKSEVIRFLILAGLCGIRPAEFVHLPNNCGEDIKNAVIAVNEAFFNTDAENGKASPLSVHVGESATLLRLLLPSLLRRHSQVRFFAGSTLLERNFDEFESCLGCRIERHSEFIEFSRHAEHLPLYSCSAAESSQFASGMLILLASETLSGNQNELFELEITNPSSRPYIELTLDVIRRFGCRIELNDKSRYHLAHGTLCPPLGFPSAAVYSYDCSYAANFVAANALGSEVCLPPPLNGEKKQADFAIRKFVFKDNIDISNSPDLFPILCILSCGKTGDTVITGTARLRGKESDRVNAMLECIRSLGGSAECGENNIIIHGTGTLRGGTVDSFHDHRIVMAAAIASLICSNPVVIRGFKAVNKSAPQFFNDFKALGGTVVEYVR